MKALILGGNRFFGKHLASRLLARDIEVTLLNRGQIDDGFGDRVQRMKADRQSPEDLRRAVGTGTWDLVYDQICYTADEARMACEIFRDKTERFIFASTTSVYDDGPALRESAFDPEDHRFKESLDPKVDYQGAKRQAEAVFARQAPFPVAMARLSLVVGTDDYTGRLQWHVDRIREGKEVHFPNLDARLDFVRSDQAGEALMHIGLSSLTGPANCTAGSFRLGDLVTLIEKHVGRPAVLAPEATTENHSPYGNKSDKWMDLMRLRSIGFSAPPPDSWMDDLIGRLANNPLNGPSRRDN